MKFETTSKIYIHQNVDAEMQQGRKNCILTFLVYLPSEIPKLTSTDMTYISKMVFILGKHVWSIHRKMAVISQNAFDIYALSWFGKVLVEMSVLPWMRLNTAQFVIT